MTKNSVLKLSETLQKKSEADSQQIESLQQQQLEKLVKSLGDTLERDLSTTRRDIAIEIKRLSEMTEQSAKSMKKQQITMLDEIQSRQAALIQVLDSTTKAAVTSLRWSWLRASVPSLAVLVVILSASWGLMHWWTNEAINLRTDIIQSQLTLKSLPTEVGFSKDSSGQYLTMKKEPEVYRTQSGGWAVKLSK